MRLTTRDLVLLALIRKSPMSAYEIGQRAGVARSSVYRAVKSLILDGSVRPHVGGYALSSRFRPGEVLRRWEAFSQGLPSGDRRRGMFGGPS